MNKMYQESRQRRAYHRVVKRRSRKAMTPLFLLLTLLVGLPAWIQAQCNNGNCRITITGTDQYGDGWNGASVSVYQDSVLIDTFTVGTTTQSASYVVCANEPIELRWTSGIYDVECAFSITDSIGSTLYTLYEGSQPTNGVLATVMPCASCPSPAIVATTTTLDSAYITVRDLGSASMWLYYYEEADGTNTTTIYTTTDTVIAIGGLSANTSYNIYIASYCGVDDTSLYTGIQLRTQCGALTLPYTENFEAYVGETPSCWHVTQSYADWTGDSYPLVAYDNQNAHSGYYIVAFLNGPEILSTPRIPLAANEIEVLFWANSENYYMPTTDLEVGYVTHVDSASSFVAVDTVVVGTTGMTAYSVDFGDLTTTDTVYVAFRYYDSTYALLYLDDVTVRRRSECPNPQGFHSSGTASGSVSLAWEAPSTCSSWDVVYGPMGMDPDTVSTYFYNSMTDSVTITGLEDSMTYDFYVRSVCDTSHSYWQGPISVRPNTFLMTANATDTIYTCGGVLLDDGGINGDYAYDQTSTMVVYPDDPSMTISLSGTADLMTMYGSSYGTLYVYEGAGTTGRLLATYTNTGNVVNVSSSVGAITLHFVSNGYSNYYAAAGWQLNVSCSEMPSCPAPYDLVVSNVAGSSATLSWSYGAPTDPDYWLIEVIDSVSTNTYNFTAADTARSIVLTGLSQQTWYEVLLQAVCGSGDYSDTLTTWFSTTCLTGGEQLVGNDTATTSIMTLPAYTYYSYSLSQQIFDATELTGLDTIYGIKFNKLSGFDMTRRYAVYLDTTDATQFTPYQLIQQDSASLYFDDDVELTTGWFEIRFRHPFIYNGTSNLIITVEDNTGSYSYYNAPAFQTNATTAAKALRAYSNSIDPSALDSNSLVGTNCTTLTQRNSIIFLTPCGDASCVAPNVTATTTSNSIVLNWVAGNEETLWSVAYQVATDSVYTTFVDTTSATTATIPGLQSNTDYNVRVTSLCSDSTNAAVVLTVTTDCGLITALPFTEDFETFTGTSNEPAFEPCWTRGTNATSYYTTYYYPCLTSYYGHNGSNQSLRMYASSYSSTYSYVALPAFGHQLDSLMLTFYMMAPYSATNGYQAVVGFMTDPADVNTFVAIDSVTLTSGEMVWQQVETELAAVPDTVQHIAIITGANSGSFYIDDIEVKYSNTCRRVINVAVDTVTLTSATISFTDTNQVGSYTLYYGTSDDIADATDSVTTSTTTVTLSPLSAGTYYYVWVRTNCCGGAGSFWTNPISFRTDCDLFVVDSTQSYTEDFEAGALDACFNQYYDADAHEWRAFDPSASGVPGYAFSGTYVAAFTHSSAGSRTLLALPSFDFSALTLGAELSYYHTQSVWYSDQDSLKVYYRTNDTAEWTLLQSFGDDISTWTEEVVTLPNSIQQPFYQIGFMGVDGYGYGVMLDDISVHPMPTCFRSDTLSATAADVQATLSWDGSANDYIVEYRLLNSGNATTVAATGHSLTITNLTPATAYEFRVRSVCAANDTSRWSRWSAFHTGICPFSTTVATDTVATTSYSLPLNNWYNYNLTEIILDSAELGGANTFSGLMLNYTDADELTLKTDVDIYIQPTTDTTFTNDDYIPLDSTAAVLVYSGSLNCATGWNYFTFDTTYYYDGNGGLLIVFDDNSGGYNGTSYDFACAATAGVKTYTNYSDNTDFDPFSTQAFSYYSETVSLRPLMQFIVCLDGCAAPVDSVVAVSYDEATIAWSGDTNSYELALRAATDADWTTTVTITGFSHTFTGLQPATAYQYQLRQRCDSALTSVWTDGTFTTDSLPCFAPANFVASLVQGQTATLSWDSATTATSWTLHVFNTTFDQTYAAATTTYTVTGLTAGVTYQAAVMADCGNGIAQSDYSDTISFTTAACDVVSDLTVSDVTGTSAVVSWTPGANNTGAWEIEYGYHGYAQGEALGLYQTTEPTYTLTALQGETHYDVTVRAVCAAGYYSNNVQTDFTTAVAHIGDVSSSATVTLTPNPAKGSTTVTLSGATGEVSLTLVDMQGRTVRHFTMECNGDCSHHVLLDGLSAGTYFVRLSGNSVNTVKKLIVK